MDGMDGYLLLWKTVLDMKGGDLLLDLDFLVWFINSRDMYA